MKKDRRLLVFTVLIMGILWLSLTPNAKALNFTYNDNLMTYLTVSGPDLAKPGNTESYTVSGKFEATANDFINITLWLETSSQPSKVILEDRALQWNVYTAGYEFTKTYPVFIPNDAVNNGYVYANMTTSIRQFSKLGISLVQNPTYADLQSQVTSLQSQVSSLQTQNDNLQSEVNSLQADKTELQSQISSLQAQNDDLRSQVNSLQGDRSELQSQIGSLNSNITDLKSHTSDLNSQINGLQSQLNDIRLQDANATNLSLVAFGIAAVFIASTIFFALRKPKAKTT